MKAPALETAAADSPVKNMAEYVTIKQKLLRGGVVGLIGASVALLVWALNLLEPWENKTWDLRVSQLAKPGKATDEIRLILVDQGSLSSLTSEHQVQ